VEAFGSVDPALDAEVIQLAVRLFERLGLHKLEVRLNSVGCAKCQPVYRAKLKYFFAAHSKEMCHDCQERLTYNPLRILDCKEPACQPQLEKAPASLDSLCPECSGHFTAVTGWLDRLQVNYQVNKRLVRGLDYYTKTAFEVISTQLGAQNAVCGGGRYDNLVQELGGKPTPAIGFAIGMERVVEILKQTPTTENRGAALDLFIITLGEEAKALGVTLLSTVRSHGLKGDMDYNDHSLKSQLKAADRLKARQALIIGEEEINRSIGLLKNLQTAQQREVNLSELPQLLLGEVENDQNSGS